MYRAPLLLTFLLLSFMLFSQEHSQWDDLLQNHVNENGEVDYQSFKNDEVKLANYLKAISENKPSSSASKEEVIAYWANLYNAYTVQAILENFPIRSIKDLKKGNIWDYPFILVDGEVMSLNYIEHGILRKNYKEPRIHFILNCAARSCPKLHNRAFTKENINSLMDQLATDFINNSNKNILMQDELLLSQIFNWYKDDFTANGNLIHYINQYAKQKVSHSATIKFKSYNWELNSISY